MDFYTALSTYYDEIFAVSQSDLDFISSCIPADGRVLDVGCGTGNKTVLLKNATSVTGIDLDTGMIERKRFFAVPHAAYRGAPPARPVRPPAFQLQTAGRAHSGSLMNVRRMIRPLLP